MPSKKPRIQGVIDDDLYRDFENWKQQQGISSDGAAIATLIRLFIRGEQLVANRDNPDTLGKSQP